MMFTKLFGFEFTWSVAPKATMIVDLKGSITMSTFDDACECSCHRDGSMHISPCCYKCLRCGTDNIRPINYGDEHCKKCEALMKLTDEELKAIVDGTAGANPRKHTLSSVLGAIGIGIEADLELSRRARERLLAQRYEELDNPPEDNADETGAR